MWAGGAEASSIITLKPFDGHSAPSIITLSVPAAGIVLGGFILKWADSKTAFATPVLASGMLLVVARLRSRLLPDFEVAGVVEEIGRERFYPSVNLAVAGCAAEA